jgi:hypothetical protein
MKAVRKPGSDALDTDFKLAYAERGLTLETQPASKKVSTHDTEQMQIPACMAMTR